MQYNKGSLDRVLRNEQNRIDSSPLTTPESTKRLVKRIQRWKDGVGDVIELPEAVITALFLAD